MQTDLGPVEVRTPRDRAGTFEPADVFAYAIGYARDGDDASVAILRIRGGKLLARGF